MVYDAIHDCVLSEDDQMPTVFIYQSPLVSQEGHHTASLLHIIHMPPQEKTLSEGTFRYSATVNAG